MLKNIIVVASDFGNINERWETLSNIEKNCGKRLNFSNWDSKISISCHASSFFFCPIHFFKNSLHEWVLEWMTSSPHFGTNRLIFYRSWIATRQLIWGLVDYLLLYSAHAGGDKQIKSKILKQTKPDWLTEFVWLYCKKKVRRSWLEIRIFYGPLHTSKKELKDTPTQIYFWFFLVNETEANELISA